MASVSIEQIGNGYIVTGSLSAGVGKQFCADLTSVGTLLATAFATPIPAATLQAVVADATSAAAASTAAAAAATPAAPAAPAVA